MTEFTIFMATHPDGNYYIGYCKDLKKRKYEMYRDFYKTVSHRSRCALTDYAIATNVHPRDWEYSVLTTVDGTVEDAKKVKREQCFDCCCIGKLTGNKMPLNEVF